MIKLSNILQEIQIKGAPTWEDIYNLYIEKYNILNFPKREELKSKIFTYMRERIPHIRYGIGDIPTIPGLAKNLDKKYLPELYKLVKNFN